eukprot:CAMPEP_0173303634 /NCGR_PEP_ID=MMETSP1143-20121109/19011_1 /TAXON_ID=483371 /ORGANISM="non described non described, Strain CCMP2298" /LENGTH=175 /DNA_ID=CAMNT_0014244391 /DNA_START=1151 /DNA_END=1674 /DNA_ORIENTATION=-
MSNEAKGTLCSFSKATICRLNPHLGSAGLPFINSITGAVLISFSTRALSCAAFSSSERVRTCGVAADASCLTSLLSSAGFAPSTLPTTAPPADATNVGTTATSASSLTSGTASASTVKNCRAGYFSDSAANTPCIWPPTAEGSCHDAQKKKTLFPPDARAVSKAAFETISVTGIL